MIHILKRPIVTEKVTNDLNLKNQYGFEVDPRANKIQIRQAIQIRFGVEVAEVRTVRVKGKPKAQMTKKGMFNGKTPLRKKAYVTLKKGQTIDIFEARAGE